MRVSEHRTYPPTGLTTARWQALPAEQVRISDLVTTQGHLRIEALITGSLRPGSDPLPNVVLHDGCLYLEDGHHRVVRALLAGHDYITARVYRREGNHVDPQAGRRVVRCSHALANSG